MTIMHWMVSVLCLVVAVNLKIAVSYSLTNLRLRNSMLANQYHYSTSLHRSPSRQCAYDQVSENSFEFSYPFSLGTLLLLFDNNSQLCDNAEQGRWPTNNQVDQKSTIHEAIQIYRQPVNEAHVGVELAKFRKIILSLDKYRINDPGSMALKYNRLLRLSLTVPNCWGGAANAVEYAGLYFPKYIQFDSKTQTNTLNTTGLWQDTLTQLLDMEYQTASSTAQHGETWDQKFFAQSQISEDSALAVHDMLLYIFRLALNISFANIAVKNVHVIFSEVGQEQVRFFPTLRSLQLAIRRDHSLDVKIISPTFMQINNI